MRRIFFIFSLLFLFRGLYSGDSIQLDIKRNIQSLDGSWNMLLNHSEAELFKSNIADKLSDWKELTVPLASIPGIKREECIAIQCAWVKRSFYIPAEKSGKSIVLKWNGIRYGASVWINEKMIAQYATLGPNTVMIPAGIIKAGQNNIVIKMNGWASLKKTDSTQFKNNGMVSFPLIPTGSSTQDWGNKSPAIFNDIWLEFYDKAYMKWILAMPDIDHKKVTFRIWLDSETKLPENSSLKVTAYNSKNAPIGTVNAKLTGSKDFQDVEVILSELELWNPEKPILNSVSLELAGCDKASFNYGMRKIEIKNGDYYLNNEILRLHGSNLVNEWQWGENYNKNVKSYVIDEARKMSLNCFRTHTQPPPTLWLDTCDHYGTMILAEMPLLYNLANPHFTQSNWDEFHKNALTDVTGWMTKLWNHPSIIIWVMSNESNFDNNWENNTLHDYFKHMDPTRPPMRSAGVTKETYDIHLCGNFDGGSDGQLPLSILKYKENANHEQTLSNTEYMNLFNPWKSLNIRYLGDSVNAYERLNFAEIAMEHTEAMRRLDFDLILPYMYASWTRLNGGNWRPDFPSPISASLHSCMSAVLASLEMGNRNYLVAENIKVPLHLINDLGQDVDADITIYLTKEDPLFVPDKNVLEKNIQKTSIKVLMKAYSHTIQDITIQLPNEQGVYFISAVTSRKGSSPVTSQRIVRTIALQKNIPGDKLLIIGSNDTINAWMNKNKIVYSTSVNDIDKAKTILVWNAEEVFKNKTSDIQKAIENGASLIIVDQSSWNWNQLADFKIEKPWDISRVFISKGQENHPSFSNMNPELFKRWNGLPYVVVKRQITGPFVDASVNLIWGINQTHKIYVEQKIGKGKISVCQLLIKNHFSSVIPNYDPAAEQILFNLLR